MLALYSRQEGAPCVDVNRADRPKHTDIGCGLCTSNTVAHRMGPLIRCTRIDTETHGVPSERYMNSDSWAAGLQVLTSDLAGRDTNIVRRTHDTAGTC